LLLLNKTGQADIAGSKYPHYNYAIPTTQIDAMIETDTDYFLGLEQTVTTAIQEDLGSGDVTVELIDEKMQAKAEVISRDSAIICGIPWVNEVFYQIDSSLTILWQVKDGDQVEPNQLLLTIEGNARSILTGERTALNFLQSLSATATQTNYYNQLISHTEAQLLDTRKTIPGLRRAQKYAVSCGGGTNHRMGLFDAFLIKENHIMACGSIADAISRAKTSYPDRRIEIEVENMSEFMEAVDAEPNWIMLDNFSKEDMTEAVKNLNKDICLEASGGIESESDLIEIAETGVQYISVGALTKHIHAVDLSLRLVENTSSELLAQN
jgi:nicotinate-nucleotide pyrophosphorylase (carboxylating)